MEEFKDENNPINQEDQKPEEILLIRKEDQPDYDPDDDLQFQISPIAAAFIGLAGGFFSLSDCWGTTYSFDIWNEH